MDELHSTTKRIFRIHTTPRNEDYDDRHSTEYLLNNKEIDVLDREYSRYIENVEKIINQQTESL